MHTKQVSKIKICWSIKIASGRLAVLIIYCPSWEQLWKARVAALICLIWLNFCQLPKRCKMLDVIICKRHYLSDGHWSLQLMGPLGPFPIQLWGSDKLKARLGYSTKKSWGSLALRPSDSTRLTLTHLNTFLWKDCGCSHTPLLGTVLVTQCLLNCAWHCFK